jgi:hypothetical protein
MSSVFPISSATIEGRRSRTATVALLPIFMEERRRYYNYDISVSSDLSMLFDDG